MWPYLLFYLLFFFFAFLFVQILTYHPLQQKLQDLFLLLYTLGPCHLYDLLPVELYDDDDDEVMLDVPRCKLTYSGQAETNAEACFNIALRPRKPEGSLGRTAPDGHLDSRTAPELWVELTFIIILYSLYFQSSKYNSVRWCSCRQECDHETSFVIQWW